MYRVLTFIWCSGSGLRAAAQDPVASRAGGAGPGDVKLELTSVDGGSAAGGAYTDAGSGSQPEGDKVLTVQVMSTMEHRDVLFGSDEFPFDMRRTVFVWSGKGDPFFTPEGGDAQIAKRVMRFLCLVADWERENLADSIFSALGVRVVDALHG